MIIAQIAVFVLCVVIIVSAVRYFGDDPAEICVLFTGCVAGHFSFYHAPLSSAQAVAIFAGCIVGYFVYTKFRRLSTAKEILYKLIKPSKFY